MIGLIQRVSHAKVEVSGQNIGAIGPGILLLFGVEKGDSEAEADRLLERVLTYRIFADADGKMNRSLRDTTGGLLVVPQFTLAADTKKGTRPGFQSAAPVDKATNLFNYFVSNAKQVHENVEQGEFGADMQVSLLNDGPVTFWLQVPNSESR